ncbi:MAG TPA: hypothetical protein VFY29_04580 [Terriglobia bacterium]|nr:hypothetical protein [Terriglobia bacterium]
MHKILTPVSLLLLLATAGLAQSRFDGKWKTDRPQNPELLSDQEKRGGAAQLELTVVEASGGPTVKGALSLGGLGGDFYTFDQGKGIDGTRVYFRIEMSPSTYSTWYVDMVDDDTIALWSYGLDLVGTNVQDLIQSLPAAQPQSAVSDPVAPPAPQAAPAQAVQGASTTALASSPPERVTSCGANRPLRCYLLHRAK